MHSNFRCHAVGKLPNLYNNKNQSVYTMCITHLDDNIYVYFNVIMS